MKEQKWETGQDDEELFEYAMHPAQYEAYKSGKAKEDFWKMLPSVVPNGINLRWKTPNRKLSPYK